MNRAETAQFLAVVQTYDQRTVGETDVIAWHGAVGDLTFTECRDGAIQHYRTTTDRLMPAHVRALVATARRAAAGEERQQALESREGRRSDHRGPMPSWFRGMYEKALAETRASGKYQGPGPMAKDVGDIAQGKQW